MSTEAGSIDSPSHDTRSWAEFETACSGLAERIRRRFESHRHAVMATLRADGSPRLSGMEAPIRDGHLWLGMGPDDAKTTDLRRDPRLALHSAPDAEELPDGDARIEGRAVPTDAEQLAVFLAGHRFEVDEGSEMALFTVDISRAVLVRVEGTELVVESWTPAGGYTEHRSD